MASLPVRDPSQDHLLTPKNAALIIIDYQPVQVTSVASMDRRALVENIVSVAKGAMLFKLPIVLSTVNVKTGRNAPTIKALQEVLGGNKAGGAKLGALGPARGRAASGVDAGGALGPVRKVPFHGRGRLVSSRRFSPPPRGGSPAAPSSRAQETFEPSRRLMMTYL